MKKLLLGVFLYSSLIAGISAQKYAPERQSVTIQEHPETCEQPATVRGSFPFKDQLTVYDKENQEFRLQMHKDEVIAQQGEPDTIEYSTYYPSGKDEYNIVQTVYDSGIEFTYRKGFPEIIGIRITTQNYWISADKLSPHNSTVEDVFNCYGTMPYRTSIERNNDNFELHLTYLPRNIKEADYPPEFSLYGDIGKIHVYQTEYLFSARFHFDYNSKRCQTISLFEENYMSYQHVSLRFYGGTALCALN